MDTKKIDLALEAVLFASDKPLPGGVLSEVLEIKEAEVEEAIGRINAAYVERGSAIKIQKIAGGFEFLTLPEYAPFIKKLYRNRMMMRLSKPALEVLAIIAYKQPITKQEVELIRGVNSDGVYHTLLERKLIKIAGRKDSPGRPLMYGSTKEFLQYLGINSLEDLPKIEEIKAILEKDENVESWDAKVEAARGQQIFDFADIDAAAQRRQLNKEIDDLKTEEILGDSVPEEGGAATEPPQAGVETETTMDAKDDDKDAPSPGSGLKVVDDSEDKEDGDEDEEEDEEEDEDDEDDDDDDEEDDDEEKEDK
jgi:segregation and condensation protein B